MAISKNSVRVQFTLNLDKEKEKCIAEFLGECLNSNNTIKEIIYNHVVSNCDTRLLQVTNLKVTQSEVQLPKVSKSDNIILDLNNKVSNGEEQLHEVSEIELNELEELSKFY